MLQGITESIATAERVQERFNSWDWMKRYAALFSHERLMNRIRSKHRLECECRNCQVILDSFHKHGQPCPKCGSTDIASQYYC